MVHDCMVFRPVTEPRGIIHFLGGVFASASPQLLYRYFLQRLSSKGYVVVAIPYEVSFDYLAVADDIVGRYERAAKALQEEYGGRLPQVAVGHSLGALMHSLIASLFAESVSQFAGAVLIAHNNKQLKDAIPAFEDLFAPALAPYGDFASLPSYEAFLDSAKQLRATSVALAKEAAGRSPGSERLVSFIEDFANLLALTDQVPPLLEGISDGIREFTPKPADLQAALRTAYCHRRTLIVSFSADSIDESDQLEVLVAGRTDIERARLEGSHVTPLAFDASAALGPVLDSSGRPALSGLVDQALGAASQASLRDVDVLTDTLDEWCTRNFATQEPSESLHPSVDAAVSR